MALRGQRSTRHDAIVLGRSREEHDARLQAALDRPQQHQVTLNMDKCPLGVETIEFLGLVISKEGTSVNPTSVQGIRDPRALQTTKELQTAPGIFGFYSRFKRNYSTRAEVPRRQLRKDAGPLRWTTEMEDALRDAREAIISSTALAKLDPTLPTLAATDASDVGPGPAPSQPHEEGERAVSRASSTSTSAQRRHSATEREAPARVWAAEHRHKHL